MIAWRVHLDVLGIQKIKHVVMLNVQKSKEKKVVYHNLEGVIGDIINASI